MKKVLCDKDGKFISIHDEDYYLTELNDGDCLTHEDGTILIYKESEEDPLLENIYFHAYYKNGGFFSSKNNSSFHDYVSCGYRFSTKEEKKRMNEILSENNLYYDEKEKCLKNLRWRAKKGYMYYYIDFNGPDSFCVASRTETFDYIDECKFNTHNYFQTEKEAEKKLDSIKNILND